MIQFENILKDTLYNTHPRSGASVDYGKGIVVGVVGALMAVGHGYAEVIRIVALSLPEGYRVDCIPESWNRINELYREA